MSLSTNVRPPRFIPSVLTKVNAGCRRRCAFPELCPVSNKDFRHSSMPAVWLGSSGQSMEWDGRNSCALKAAEAAVSQEQESKARCRQTSPALVAPCFHDGSRSQILPSHCRPWTTLLSWGCLAGQQLPTPQSSPATPWALFCVNTLPLLWVTLQGPTTSDSQEICWSLEVRVAPAQDMVVLQRKMAKSSKICRFSNFFFLARMKTSVMVKMQELCSGYARSSYLPVSCLILWTILI